MQRLGFGGRATLAVLVLASTVAAGKPAEAAAGGAAGTALGPVILKHSPPSSAEREKELVLRANIIAAAGAYLPTLYYRPVGESRYYSLPMLPVPGALSIYAASVPGIFVTRDLEYYLESYDTLLHGPGNAGSQKAPIKVSVVDPQIPPSQVVVRSDPGEALLRVDGKDVGKTPWIGMLPPGTHELVLKKDGFLETVTTLEVPEGRDLDTLRALSPAAEQATFAVTSEPTGATVTIDGQVLGTTPLIAPSPDGQHKLTLEKQGFARGERTMLFSKERSMETSFTLTKLPPEPALAITSEPPGAKVVVDGKELGKTPFIGVVPTGEHVLELKLDQRRPAQAQIMMPEDRDLDLRFTLEKAEVQHTPIIAISSDPASADVFVDDAPVGKSPYLDELKAGSHKIKVTAPGFQPYEKKLVMPETSDMELTLALVPVPPPPGPSKVLINAEPGDVEVSIDGKPAGKVPVNVELPAGAHVATAKKDGFRATEERFAVVQGQGLQLKLTLQPVAKDAENPVLSVNADPDGAQVSIDGARAGVTPFSTPLVAGKHKLLVTKDGFKPRAEAFELPKDKAFELRYSFNLEPLRRTVSLASASDLKKDADKPKRPIVDLAAVQKERRAPAEHVSTPGPPAASGAAASPAAQKDAEAGRRLHKRVLEVARDASTPRYGPLALAGTGVLLTSVGVLFGVAAQAGANDLGDPRGVVDRQALADQHTRNVRLSVGLGLGGVVLAAAGAVWASWPRSFDFGLSPDRGGGDGAPRVALVPEPGGATLAVGGRF